MAGGDQEFREMVPIGGRPSVLAMVAQGWVLEQELTEALAGPDPASPYDVERLWPIADLNDDPSEWTAPCLLGGCAYGACRPNLSDPYGCGGCCHCLGGCQVDHERQTGAPYVWEGDQA